MLHTTYMVLFHSFLIALLLLGPTVEAADSSEESSDELAGMGVRVDFQARPAEGSAIRSGEDVIVSFRLSESHSGEPVTHLHPAAWLTLRQSSEGKPDGEACRTKIISLLQKGVIRKKAEGDLNSFFILSMNADNSIGIIDPSVNLNTANVVGLIRFKGEPAEWAVDEERSKVFVTLPEEGSVAVADVQRRVLHGYIEVGSAPRRILLPSAGRHVWVGSDAAGTVSAIDRESLRVVRTLPAGGGPLDLASDGRDRYVFMASGRDGTLSIVDSRRLEEVARLQVGEGESSLAWSPLSALLYVVNRRSGALVMIDPEKAKIVNSIELGSGVSALRATPDGRFLLALFPAQRAVKVIDAALSRVVGELPTEADPDHVIFTADYAYIRNRGTPNITVIQLKGLEDPAKAAVVAVPFGAVPPDQVKAPASFNTMEVFPHGGHILGVNPADRTVYLYMEGMMVPMSSFKTYTDRPLGLLVYNQGLRERDVPGDYATMVRLDEPGTYDVPFFLDSPRVAACFELHVEANPDAESRKPPKPAFTSYFDGKPFLAGAPSKLRFKLHDERSGNPMAAVRDIVVMSTLKGSHWQHRAAGAPLGDGLYEAEFVYPREGTYLVLVEAPSIGVSFGDLRFGVAEVVGRMGRF